MKHPTVLYKFVGSDPTLHNMLFKRLAEFCAGKNSKPTKETWPAESDKWKYDLGDEDVFAISIENHLQPPHIKKIMSEVSELDGELVVSEGVPGIIWRGSRQSFEKEFKRIGK